VETLLRIDYKAARPHSQPGYFVDEKNFWPLPTRNPSLYTDYSTSHVIYLYTC
jgi:hypothetical protein